MALVADLPSSQFLYRVPVTVGDLIVFRKIGADDVTLSFEQFLACLEWFGSGLPSAVS